MPLNLLSGRRPVVLSLGMGVDSVALVIRLILDPTCRDFDLRDLVLVTSMTGEELSRTEHMMYHYLLPLLRAHSVRYVQICRAGQAKAAGYVVLSDTRAPARMHMLGPWRLSDELRTAGTLPSVRKGRRWCSDRAKGEVIDAWVRDHIEPGYIHMTGYAAEEGRRAERDTKARKEKEGKGQVVLCRPSYPLQDWNWDRERCAAYLRTYLFNTFRVAAEWPRSCCTFCPFQETAGGRDELAERWRSFPHAGVTALELEQTALAMNPRIGLFGTGRTAADFVVEHDLGEVIDLVTQRAEQVQVWDVLEIRRFFPAAGGDPEKKGRAWRSVRAVATGTREEMRAWLAALENVAVEVDTYGITRAWRRRRADQPVYPAIEWLFALVPRGVQDKQLASFETKWDELHSPALF